MDDSLKTLGIYLLNTDIVPLTSIHPPLDFLTVCAFSWKIGIFTFQVNFHALSPNRG